MDDGSIFFMTAVASTNVLKVDPACRRAWAARLNSYFRPGVTAVIARMAPFAGLIETTADAGSPGSSSDSRIEISAARWKRGLIVV